jgi:hypothetical protein
MYRINIGNHSKFILFLYLSLVEVSIQPFRTSMSHQVEAHVIRLQMCVAYIFCMKKSSSFKTTYIVTKKS